MNSTKPSMNKQRDAFVVTPGSIERVCRLNAAVRDCAILPIVGDTGCGKNRLLNWWWQTACSDSTYAGTQVVQPEEILCINAQLAPSASVPMACVIFTKLLAALEELERALLQHRRPQPIGRLRSWITESQTLSLIYEHVHPLFAQLQPQAIVITNAQLLDERALQLLLELRRPTRRGVALVPQCALIFCAYTEAPTVDDSQVSKLFNKVGETRAVWPERLAFHPLTVAEFGSVMRKIIEQNLYAEFAPEVDARTALIQFGKWTHANWWLMTQLTKKLDHELGATRDGKARVLTPAIINNVQAVWQSRVE